MPPCECAAPCNCYFTEDGFFANRPEDGRRNTIVTGTGSGSQGGAQKPFVLEFQMSEFYRPPSTELRLFPRTIPDTTLGTLLTADLTEIQYESPSSEVVLQSWERQTLTFQGIGVAVDEFKIVGASAKFPASSVAGASSQLVIGALNPKTGFNQTIASQRCPVRSNGPTYLTCSAFSPGILELPTSPLDFTPLHKMNVFYLSIGSTTDMAITVTDIKFWMTTI